jgi:hypothetical protein
VMLLLSTACGRREILVVEDEHGGHGPDVPFARSADPRVHPAGEHDPAPTVAIGPEGHGDVAATPYVPFAASHDPLVRTAPPRGPY